MRDNSYLDEEEWKKAKRMLIFRSIVKMDNGNRENINNAIDALNDPQYLLDNPRMKGFTEILSNALNAYKRGDNEEYESIISSLKENHHTARRKLAKCLQDKALFETTVNVPDLTRLVPDNIQDKRKGYTRVAQHLRDYYNNNEVALSEDAKVQDSKINKDNTDFNEVGVVFSSGIGGINSFYEEIMAHAAGDGTPRFNPFIIPKLLPDLAGGHISIKNGFLGPNYSTVSACASSANAIVEGYNYIHYGMFPVIVVGGSEAAISPPAMAGFEAMRAMTTRNDDPMTASRPFDKDRDGFLMGEGCGCLVLEDLDHNSPKIFELFFLVNFIKRAKKIQNSTL